MDGSWQTGSNNICNYISRESILKGLLCYFGALCSDKGFTAVDTHQLTYLKLLQIM